MDHKRTTNVTAESSVGIRHDLVLNDLAESSDGSFKVAKVDVDKNKVLAQKYAIRSIPTLVALKDGKEVARYIGVKKKNFLLEELKKL